MFRSNQEAIVSNLCMETRQTNWTSKHISSLIFCVVRYLLFVYAGLQFSSLDVTENIKMNHRKDIWRISVPKFCIYSMIMLQNSWTKKTTISGFMQNLKPNTFAAIQAATWPFCWISTAIELLKIYDMTK